MKWLSRLNWSLSPHATANFGLVLFVLLFNCIVIHRNTVQLQTAQDSIDQAHEMRVRTQSVFSSLCDAQAEARAYVVTGEASYKTEYQRVVDSIPSQLVWLRDSAMAHTEQAERVAELSSHIESRLATVRSVVEIRETQGVNAAREQVLAETTSTQMDRVRQDIAELQKHEDRRLARLNHDQANSLFIVLAANLAAMLVGASVTIVAWCLVERELRKRRVAEKTAELERQNLWETLTSIGDGVIVADNTGHVSLANQIARDLLGANDVVGRRLPDVFKIVNEITGEPVEVLLGQVLTRGRIVSYLEPTVLLSAGGNEIPIEQTAAPIRNTAGAITGVVLVFRECSIRRRLEREMQERERRFRKLFETPLIGIAIGTLQGDLLEANDAFLDLIGYRRNDLKTGPLNWTGISAGQNPVDDIVRRELLETGACKPFERTYVRGDGTRVPVLISAARLLDEKDRIVTFVTDLTQSKRAEAALRESDARFRVLSECMPQKVWTARPDGRLDYSNHMLIEYSGMTAEQLMGWGWLELIHPDDKQTHQEAWRQSLATGDMFEMEYRLRMHTGEFRWHIARALPMYNTDSQIVIWVGTNTDIHDQKRAEEELLEEHHRKDQFLALLAHELRNPLAPLSNAIQVFPSVQNDPSDSAALLGIMQRQVGQMTRLIDDLLDLARVTTGRMRLRRERVQLKSVVAAAIESVQPLVTEREHQLIVSVPDAELWLDADHARLAQVLTNVLHNSVKYTDAHGRLELIVEHNETDVLVHVRDNGPGISKEMLTKIFDLFTQAEPTLDRAHGGLGIGLTLVRTLVELHGGAVTALSEGIGLGSEFLIRLPLVDPPPLEPPNMPLDDPSAAKAPCLDPLRILVVDDVQASAKTLALMLRSLGQDAQIAFDGPSTIRCVKENRFDLVFLDIAMPGMDGFEVARRLRIMPNGKALILVALTGFGQEEDSAQSLQAGFDYHLTKPTSLDALKRVLERAHQAQAEDRSPETV